MVAETCEGAGNRGSGPALSSWWSGGGDGVVSAGPGGEAPALDKEIYNILCGDTFLYDVFKGIKQG